MLSKVVRYFSPRFKSNFLNSDDIAICPICGDYTHLWQTLKDDGECVGYNCTTCGFWAGKYARWWYWFELKKTERKIRYEKTYN
jgi:hypothetical protein